MMVIVLLHNLLMALLVLWQSTRSYTKMCDIVPENVNSIEAAALASSGTPALQLSRRIQADDKRVLSLGAGGGVGSHLCQLLKMRGVEYVAGVSKDPKRLLIDPINCDHAVDYTKDDPFTIAEWKENPFDVVIDLASGGWPRLLEQSKKRKVNSQNCERGRKVPNNYC